MPTVDRKTLVRTLVLFVAAPVFVSMWVRIRNLEKNVDSLQQIVLSRPSVVTVGQNPSRGEDVPHKSVFKLIESQPTDQSPKSSIGVPWDVERAMMGGAHEGELTRKIKDPPEYAPAPILQTPNNSAVQELNNNTDSN